jgi:hypothetical protein
MGRTDDQNYKAFVNVLKMVCAVERGAREQLSEIAECNYCSAW